MTRVAFKHLSGSRRGQVELFDLTGGHELTFGRDPSCDVRYAEEDDIVSRRHIKIEFTAAAVPELLLIDLGSSNGTFVNNQRVFGPLKLRAGDVLRLGAGGPEAKLELQLAVERAESAAAPAPTAAKPLAPAAAAPAPPAPVPPRNGGHRHRLLPLLLPLAAVLLLAVGAWFYAPLARFWPLPRRAAKPQPAPATARFTDSVVLVEWRWNLVDSDSGRPLYYLFAPNHQAGVDSALLVANAGAFLPVFVLAGGRLEPVVTASDGNGRNQPIAGQARSCGFFATPRGTVLTLPAVEGQTSRARSWRDAAGMVVAADETFQVNHRAALVSQLFPAWAPAAANAPVEGELDSGAVHLKGNLRGRIQLSSSVVLGAEAVAAAPVARAGSSGLAVLRVPAERAVPTLEISADAESVKTDDVVTVVGYAAPAGIEPPERPQPQVVTSRITRVTAAGPDASFELAPGPTPICPGAAVLNRSGQVIGILRQDGERWYAVRVVQAML